MASLASAPLALIKVAPGKIFVNGDAYDYANHEFTISDAADGGHVVTVSERFPIEEARTIVITPPDLTRWDRFKAWWRSAHDGDSWPKGYEEIGAVVVDQ